MNGRCGWVLAVMLVAAILGLTGCSDAVTVHSMAKGVPADLEVPAVAGRWQLANSESGAPLLIVDHRPDDTGLCRAGLVRIASDRIELCGGLPIWVMLAELKQDRPTGYSLAGVAE
jgi:hypothetical protein